MIYGKRFLRRLTPLLAALLLLAVGFTNASAAVPLAGTSIGNQASATYTDASAISRTATSNTVTTIVQQVASFTLTAHQSKNASPGSTVYFAHTLTNTGNGADTFGLTAVDADTGGFNFVPVMYADANGDGIPDNATTISSTGALAAGTAFRFVVAATVPGTATGTETITVTGASGFGGFANQTNTDTVVVTGNAVISMTKSLSVSSGPSPSTGNILVTLTYTNTGNTAARRVTITDVIGTGATAGMTYVPSTTAVPLWSGGGTLTDTAGAADDGTTGINYSFASNTVTAVIDSVGPTVSGTLRFYVTVKSGVAPGTATTNNQAKYEYNDVGLDAAVTVTDQFTNFAAYNVLQTAGVVANGSSTSSTNLTGEPVYYDSNGNGLNDETGPTYAGAAQGSIVSFNNYIWNTGNGVDAFDLTLTGTAGFPAGTTFQLYQSDGVTPLTSTGGTGAPDTGPVAVGAHYKVVVKATLPASATGGGPYTVTLTATSIFDNTKNDPVIDQLTTITGSTVDLTNNFAAGHADCDGTTDPALCGFGAGGTTGEAAAQTTNSVNPGSSTTFKLYVKNTLGPADSYNLYADQNTTFTNSNDLPADWTVLFREDASAGACTTFGTTITNTGVINLNASKLVCATITVPANAPAGTTSIYFRAVSPTTGAADPKHDAVTVNTIRAIAITPDNSGQIFPGGTVVYSHILKNNGNVVEGDGTLSSIVLNTSNSLTGWGSVIYFDADNNGILDGTDPVVPVGSIHTLAGTAASLAIGEELRFFVRVNAPLGAAIGDINQTLLTATTSNGTYTTTIPAAVSAQDTTQVIAGQVRMVKTQALDAACDGTADTAFNEAQITTGAVPGACIRYRVVATNDGTANITTLVISDATPANTVYDDGSRNAAGAACGLPAAVDAAAATTVGTITTPVCNSAGTVQATVGTLAPGASATITFGVMINNN